MQRGRYRGRGGRGARGGAAFGQTNRLRGLFADGVWHCDCSPRLPAEHFKVKKEGKNQGRWFYTCQNSSNGCSFFLWEEDSKPRETAAVLANSRTEPAADRTSAVQDGWDAGRNIAPQGQALSATNNRQDAPTQYSRVAPTPVSVSKAVSAGDKRKRGADDINGTGSSEEDFFEPLTGMEAEELARAAEQTPALQTPQKAQKMGVYATPATTGRKSARKLPWISQPAEPASPSTATRKQPKTVNDYFITYHELPTSANEWPETPTIQPDSSSSLTAPDSPSPPSRYKDALSNPADSASSLTSEVLSELSSCHLPPDTLSSLRSVLSRHDLKTQGVVQGRDITRLALKAKDAKIKALEATIASLEAERERDRGRIRKLQWNKEYSQEDEDESQL